MEIQQEKCVLVLDPDLPLGVIANTAAICGITLGKHRPDAVGPDVTDRDGNTHSGIIEFPVPVLRASRNDLKQLRQRLYSPDFAAVAVVDFSDLAQGCRTYDEYIFKAAEAEGTSLTYLGLGLCGPRKLVDRLTGNLPLLR